MNTPAHAIAAIEVVAWFTLVLSLICFGIALSIEMDARNGTWGGAERRQRFRNNWVTGGIAISLIGVLIITVLAMVGNSL